MLAAGAVMMASVLLGCSSQGGGSPTAGPTQSGGSPTAVARPTPAEVPTPAAVYGRGQRVPKGAVAVVKRYFAAVTQRDRRAALHLLTPESRERSRPFLYCREVSHVRVDPLLDFAPPPGLSATLHVRAYMRPVDPTVGWGPPGKKYFFATLREWPARVWRIDFFSTGP